MNPFWSWALAAVGLCGLWLAPRHGRIGWAIGTAAQLLWAAYALATSQHGFLATAAAYAFVYSRNFRLGDRKQQIPAHGKPCPGTGCSYGLHKPPGAPIHVLACTICRSIDFDDLVAQVAALSTAPGALPAELRGDGPCRDCGTAHNICWFTANVFWNRVMGGPGTMDDPGGILCIPCFVKRTDQAGFAPQAWQLVPDWHWETTRERQARRTTTGS